MKNLFLTLSATSLLYHLTSQVNAVNILKTNKFQLKPSEGTSSEEELSSGYYLSTTRSRVGAYVTRNISNSSVLFVLDGLKLNHRYKIKPVDYWQIRDSSPELLTQSDETEDRVLTQKPMIPAIPYIREVHVVFSDVDVALKLKKLCIYTKLPLFFYPDSKSLMQMDRRKIYQLSLKDLVEIKKGVKEKKQELDEDEKMLLRRIKAREYADRRLNPLSAWMELFKVPVSLKSKLSKRALRCLNSLYYHKGYHKSEAVTSLSVDLHNAKSKSYGDPSGYRESLDKLIIVFRKNKFTPSLFVDFLYDKWIKKAS